MKGKLTNKRAVGEIFSWGAGLIAIIVVVIVANAVYGASSIGKTRVGDSISVGSFFSEGDLQRVGSYALLSDLSSVEKGKILFSIYNDVSLSYQYVAAYNPYAISKQGVDLTNINGIPPLLIEGYSFLDSFSGVMSLSRFIFVPCKNCVGGYVPVGVGRKK